MHAFIQRRENKNKTVCARKKSRLPPSAVKLITIRMQNKSMTSNDDENPIHTLLAPLLSIPTQPTTRIRIDKMHKVYCTINQLANQPINRYGQDKDDSQRRLRGVVIALNKPSSVTTLLQFFVPGYDSLRRLRRLCSRSLLNNRFQ